MRAEKSSADINRSVPQMFESPNEPKGSALLPKVMFAEWLSLESFASLGEPMDSKSTLDHNTIFQDNFLHDYLLDERAFGGEYHNSLSDGSSGDIFSSEFKFESQSPGKEFDFSSGEDLCSDFNLSNISDVMYIWGLGFQKQLRGRIISDHTTTGKKKKKIDSQIKGPAERKIFVAN